MLPVLPQHSWHRAPLFSSLPLFDRDGLLKLPPRASSNFTPHPCFLNLASYQHHPPHWQDLPWPPSYTTLFPFPLPSVSTTLTTIFSQYRYLPLLISLPGSTPLRWNKHPTAHPPPHILGFAYPSPPLEKPIRFTMLDDNRLQHILITFKLHESIQKNTASTPGSGYISMNATESYGHFPSALFIPFHYFVTMTLLAYPP